MQAFSYTASFDPLVEFYGEAFPVNIISVASLKTSFDGESPRMASLDDDNYIGDIFGDFGVTLTQYNTDNIPLSVRVEIEGDRFIKKSGLEAEIPPNRKIEIFPRIAYDYNVLERLVQPTNENVYFRLYVQDKLVQEKHEVVNFHSVNEVPFKRLNRRDGENFDDLKYLFAAYVNEDDPIIDTILKEALQIGVADKIGYGKAFSFSGYQKKDEDGDASLSVDLQVLAVWSVFLEHKIKYSNITTTSTVSSKINVQYVRTPGESFGNSQANCVDGTVLFASVLRKIGIEPFLVFVPRHMFLGYFTNDDFSDIEFLETTMLGETDLSKFTKDESFIGKLKNFTGFGQTRSKATLNSFLAAQQAGWDEFNDAKDKFDDENEKDYFMLVIGEMRYKGIQPIRRY